MLIKQIKTVFNDYHKTSLLVAFPKCSFKCCTESGISIETCQNCNIAWDKSISKTAEEIITYYDRHYHNALILGGLEPLDTEEDMLELIGEFRKTYQDDIVIYTGYYLEEISQNLLTTLENYGNIIVKIGRFIPNKPSVYDEVLGITLASDNQYAIKLGGN